MAHSAGSGSEDARATWPGGHVSSLGERSTPVSLFAPGTLLGGKFEICGLIGEGGMGLVYAGCQLSVGRRRVAIKVLRERELRDPSARERFRREALLIA